MGEEQKSWAGTSNRKAEAKTIKRLFEKYQSRSVLSTELKKIGSDMEGERGALVSWGGNG